MVVQSVVRLTGNLTTDVTKGISKTIGGVTYGIELLVKAVIGVLLNLSRNMKVITHKVIRNANEFTGKISRKIGKVVKVVPILGKPVAYVIKSTQKGIFYIVINLGNLTGKTLTSIGRVGKKTGNVLIFTLSTSSKLTRSAVRLSGKTVNKLLNQVKKRKKNKK